MALDEPLTATYPDPVSPEDLREWQREFEAAARRPLAQRFRYSFIRTHKPVLDDAPYRSFDSMEEYRRWCEENLPAWLGYGRSL
jgi:hypothetical protein